MDEDTVAAMESSRCFRIGDQKVVKEYESPVSRDSFQIAVKYARRNPLEVQAGRDQVDADDLYKRLQAIPVESDARDVLAPWPSASLTPNTSTRTTPDGFPLNPRWELEMANELAAYQALVADGGRPAYPIESLEDVKDDRYTHFQLLYQWCHVSTAVECYPADWEVFQRQMFRWEHFRQWQLRQRDQFDDLSLEKFIEMRRGIHQRKWAYYRYDANDPVTPERPVTKDVYNKWLIEQRGRALGRRFIREEREKGVVDFARHTETIKSRLSEYGFTGHVEFDSDPRKQNKLATWAEYVDFELRWLAAYEREFERAASDEEKDWQKSHPQGQYSEMRKPAKRWYSVVVRFAFKLRGDDPRQLADHYRTSVYQQKVLAQWALDQLFLVESEERLPPATNPDGCRSSAGVDNMKQQPNRGTVAFQDTGIQESKRCSARIRSLGVRAAEGKLEQTNASKLPQQTPLSAANLVSTRKRKNESGDSNNSGGRLSRAKRVANQNPSSIARSTMALPTLQEEKMMYSAGDATTKSSRATKAGKKEDASRPATGKCHTGQERKGQIASGKNTVRVSHGDDASREVNAEAAESEATNPSRKRKRAQTAEEIEMSTARLQSLRKRRHVNYRV